MINLLPQEKKLELKTEYRLRLGSVALLSAAVVVFFAAGAFLPLYASLSSRAQLLDVSTAANVATESQQETTRAAVDQTRRQLAVLQEGESRHAIATQLIPEVVERKGDAEIQGISYSATGEDAVLRANGVAPQREDLIAFIRALEQSGMFTEVQSPVSNLVREENLVFSLELVLSDL